MNHSVRCRDTLFPLAVPRPKLPRPTSPLTSLLPALPPPLPTIILGTSKCSRPSGGGQGGPRTRGGAPGQARGGGAAVPRAAGEHGEGPRGREAAGVDCRAATAGGSGIARRHGAAQAQHRREFFAGSREEFAREFGRRFGNERGRYASGADRGRGIGACCPDMSLLVFEDRVWRSRMEGQGRGGGGWGGAGTGERRER